MTDKKSSESRRKLLKSIAAGSGAVAAGTALPKKWSKPLVNSVVLPAHAQTTGCPSCTGPESTSEDKSTVVIKLISGTVAEGTVKLITEDEINFDGTVKDGELDFDVVFGCGGFFRASGIIVVDGVTNGSFAWNSGEIDSDGDLCWGSGTFSGKQSGNDDEWIADVDGTETCCKAA